jgi:hypothetical protein
VTTGDPPLVQIERPSRTIFTVKEITSQLFREKWFIGGWAIAALCLGFLFLWASAPVYTAMMTVAPPSASEMPTQGQVLSNLSSVLGSGQSPDSFLLYLDLITNPAVIQRVEDEHHVSQAIFSQRWDAATHQWRARTGLNAYLGNSIRRLIGRSPNPKAPTIDDLVDFITTGVSINKPALGSPERVISFTSNNPQLAAEILLWLHKADDEIVRQTTLTRTLGTMRYLRIQLPEVTNSDEHYALSNLLVEQERNLTLLSSGVDYSAMIVDPPITPVTPSPPIGKTLVLFFLAGFLIGCVFVLLLPAHAEGRFRFYASHVRALLRGYWQMFSGRTPGWDTASIATRRSHSEDNRRGP